MKNLFYSLITILVAFIFSSCSTYQYELGTMSTQDQSEKIELLNKQEKKQSQVTSREGIANQNDLLSEADKNSLLRIKESKTQLLERMAKQDKKHNIRVRSLDGYEAAYFYQVVQANANSNSSDVGVSSTMNLLLMNKTRQRQSYRSTDPNSVTAKIFLVKPKEAKPGFSIQEAKVIRQVSSVHLSAEGKTVLKLPVGFYIVDFVHKGQSVWKAQVSMLPQYKVQVSPEDLRGTNYTTQDIDNYAYVQL